MMLALNKIKKVILIRLQIYKIKIYFFCKKNLKFKLFSYKKMIFLIKYFSKSLTKK